MVYFNPLSTTYNSFERADLGNLRFYQGGVELNSWCESGCNSITSTNAVFWLKLTNTIGAGATNVVDVVFGSLSTGYDGPSGYAGEAPQLSPSYAQYDNGASVFSFYDNFAGGTVNPGYTKDQSSGD